MPVLPRLASLAVAATASVLAVAPPAGVVVTQTGGSVIDGSGVYSDWGLAQAHWAHGLEAYSLTDKGDVANAEWGIADYATQGSLIGEKLVSQGGASQRALVRSWLLKLPVQKDGKAWGTEEGPYHMGGQGALEGNAEAILLARAHAAHSGEAAVFTSVPERLVCYVPAGSTTPVLANAAAQAGLDSAACGVSPGALPAAYPSAQLYPEWPAAPGTVVTQFFTLAADGKANTESLTIPAPFTSLSLALTPQGGGAPWATTVLVADAATGAVVGRTTVTGGNFAAWTSVPVSSGGGPAPAPAGTYIVLVYANDKPSPPAVGEGAGFTQLGWLTNAFPSSPGGSGQMTYANSSATLVPADAAPQTLAQRLAAVMQWQLNASLLPDGSAYDVLVVRDPRYRGTGDVGVNSASSYYDLYRMGFAGAYISLRYLESLVAYADMQAAGLLPSDCGTGVPQPCVPAATISAATTQVRAAIGTRFGVPGTGAFVSWVSCNCTDAATGLLACDVRGIVNGSVGGGGSGGGGGIRGSGSGARVGPGYPGASQACGDAAGGMAVVDLHFLPAQARAVTLGVAPAGDTAADVSGAYAAMVSALRLTDGQFRTNGRGFEDPAVGPRLWLAFDRWKYTDSNGFAVREAQQTGDWHIFSPAAGGDGNGNFGLQEENGGALLSTNVFVFEAAADAAPGSSLGLFADFRAEVVNIAAIGAQLAAHNTSTPLLPGNRPFLRVPMTSPLIRQLCENPRGGAGTPDWWGELECGYYKTVTFDLPEDGLTLYSYAKGALGLRVAASGALSVGRPPTPLPVPGSVTIAVPAGWDAAAVAGIAVNGLNAGILRNVSVTASLAAGGGSLTVTAAVAG
jgi:hypothetical protein